MTRVDSQLRRLIASHPKGSESGTVEFVAGIAAKPFAPTPKTPCFFPIREVSRAIRRGFFRFRGRFTRSRRCFFASRRHKKSIRRVGGTRLHGSAPIRRCFFLIRRCKNPKNEVSAPIRRRENPKNILSPAIGRVQNAINDVLRMKSERSNTNRGRQSSIRIGSKPFRSKPFRDGSREITGGSRSLQRSAALVEDQALFRYSHPGTCGSRTPFYRSPSTGPRVRFHPHPSGGCTASIRCCDSRDHVADCRESASP